MITNEIETVATAQELIVYNCDFCGDRQKYHNSKWISIHTSSCEPEVDICPKCAESILDLVSKKRAFIRCNLCNEDDSYDYLCTKCRGIGKIINPNKCVENGNINAARN